MTQLDASRSPDAGEIDCYNYFTWSQAGYGAFSTLSALLYGESSEATRISVIIGLHLQWKIATKYVVLVILPHDHTHLCPWGRPSTAERNPALRP